MKKKEILQPEYLFINCQGSNAISAIKSIIDEKQDIKDALLFLHGYNMKYTRINVEELKQTTNGNPWRFQPIKLYDSDDVVLFTKQSLHHFMEFAKEQFQVDYRYIFHEEKPSDVLQELIDEYHNDKVILITVDEFYNPGKPQYYKKNHNMHVLLLKDVDMKREFIEVMDIDESQPYRIPFSDLLNSFRNCEKEHIVMFSKDEPNPPVVKMNAITTLTDFISSYAITSLLEDIHYYSSTGDDDYILRGLLFNIKFVIIPHSMNRIQSIKNLQYLGVDIVNALDDQFQLSLSLWEKLKLKISKEILKKSRIDKGIISLLEQNAYLELQITTLIHTIIQDL